MSRLSSIRSAALAASLALLPLSLSAAATPEALRALLDRGKFGEAYRLGHESPGSLGQPAFDLPFGVAAIRAGHPAEGVLALERFLLNFPDHEAARLELARGYFALREDVRAREEFEAALSRKPDPAVAALIEEFLEAIRARADRYQPTAMAYFTLGAGHDSNPRAGVDNPEITLPVFGAVTVVDSGLRRGDRTQEAGAGFRVTAPFGKGVTGFATASADATRHPEVGDFDQATYSGSVGAAGREGAWGWRAGASLAYQKLGGEPYRRVRGLALDGSWIADGRNALSAGVQGGKLVYEGANAVRDADFLSATAGWRHLLPGAWRPEVELTASAGREKNRFAERQDLSRDLLGTRLSAGISPWRGWTLGAGVSWQASDYLEPDLALQTTREDRYLAGDLSLAWRFAPSLTLRAEFLEARNRSNLELYEYRRRAASLRLRYETR